MNSYQRLAAILFLASSLCAFTSQTFLWAEEDSEKNRLNKHYLMRFTNDFGHVLVSPKSWDKKDISRFVFVCGTGIMLYAIDDGIQKMFLDDSSNTSDAAAKGITSFGNGGVLAGVIAALYAGGEISNNDSLRETALLSLESLLTSGIIVKGMKVIVGRARSGTGEPKNTFHPFSLKSSYNSFPSGHSSSAWAVASTIATQTEDTNIDLLVYSLASLVALSRVYMNKHWTSDVFIGSVIGYVVGKKICALNRNRNSARVHLSFQCSPYRQAITIHINF